MSPHEELEALLKNHKSEFQSLPSGRLKCLLTGHEFVPSVDNIRGQLANKRFKAALVERALKKFEPQIIKSPEYPDKMLCTLTGKLINKSEDAVWKHMMGSKFQKCLALREEAILAEKKSKVKVRTIVEGSSGRDTVMGEEDAEEEEAEAEEEDEGIEDEEGEQEEDEGFWVPPPGERWDGDEGAGCRWDREDEDKQKDQEAMLEDERVGGARAEEEEEEEVAAEAVTRDVTSVSEVEATGKEKRSQKGKRQRRRGGSGGKVASDRGKVSSGGTKREGRSAVGPGVNAPQKKKTNRRPG